MDQKFDKGVKNDQLKVRYDLIPTLALNLLAQLYTKGAWKYEADNWRKGLNFSRCYGALQRHANAFWAGEWMDEQLHLPHLTCVMFCCCTMIELYYTPEMKSKFDNRSLIPLRGHTKFEFKKEEYEMFIKSLEVS